MHGMRKDGRPVTVRKPRCADCKGADCHVVALPSGQGHLFLCGSCEYLRAHPDAPRAVKLPRERSKRLQRETLLDELP